MKFASSVVKDAPMLSSADIGHGLKLARGLLIVQLPSLQPTQGGGGGAAQTLPPSSRDSNAKS